MSKDNQFHQYGYGHYLKAPKKPAGGRETAMGGRSSLMRQMQSPAVATVALVAAAALFAGIIAFTYPEQQKSQQNIPIVNVPVAEVKTPPRAEVVARAPNQDSTILGRESQSVAGQDARAIENLLDYQSKRLSENESRLLKEQALAAAMEKSRQSRPDANNGLDGVPSELRSSENEAEVMSREWIESAPIIAEGGEVVDPPRMSEFVVVDSGSSSNSAAEDKVAAVEVLKLPEPPKVEPSAQNDKPPKLVDAPIVEPTVETQTPFLSASAQEKISRLATQAKPQAPVRVAQAAAPTASMDFVRDALNAPKAAEDVPAQNIEPAAGVATPSTGNAYGVYYVQLASITDASRAPAEWVKIQKQYGVLTNSSYRVENANVKGRTYYRIQAGPMSRIRANDVCDALKRAQKPGGCLVVSK